MCKTALHPFLQSLPKVEHHLHIEGTLEPSLLFELAAQNGIALPAATDPSYASPDALLARYRNFTSLDDFLPYYYTGMTALVTARDYERLAWAYLTRFARDGGVHAEMSFDGPQHVSRGIALSTVVEGLCAARRRAEKELGVSSELILCFLRHQSPEEALHVFESPDAQAAFADGSVAGIGLCSTELNKPPGDWAELFKRAKAKGLRRTAHAGEEGPAAYVLAALEDLDVERIDHGVRLADDAALMAEVARRGVMLTACPVSNVVLRCEAAIENLPIRKFLDAGVRFSINSDDPAYFKGAYILDNYCEVHETFELSEDEWASVVRNAIDGSWCSDSRKQELLAKLNIATGSSEQK